MADLKITKILTNNRYTASPEVINVTTVETDLIEDFGEPIVSLGGTIDVTSTSLPLTGVFAGTFTIGETVEAELPTYSGASGILQWVDITNNKIYVKNVTGTFLDTDLVTGQTSSATFDINVGGVGAAITQFEARYGVVPTSTANFSIAMATRRIPSGWAGGSLVYTFDGKTKPEAEENANDFIETIKVITTEKWTELIGNIDNYEGVEVVPLP
jgi:hypothetical protein